MKNVIIDCFWFLRRFPHMASLCSHVRLDHKVGEAEVKVQKFPNYQEVEVVFIIMIITNATGAQEKAVAVSFYCYCTCTAPNKHIRSLMHRTGFNECYFLKYSQIMIYYNDYDECNWDPRKRSMCAVSRPTHKFYCGPEKCHHYLRVF
jgi:hypothetical protein